MKNLSLILVLALVCACNQTIKLDLPTHNSQLVVEFYLENAMPLRCLLQESVSFTAPPQNPLIQGATVIVSYNGTSDTLKYGIAIDTLTQKIYNYTAKKILIAQPNTTYNLSIRDTKGRVLTGSTHFISPVPIEKFDYVFNPKDSVSVGIFFRDPANVDNFYRAIAYKQKPRIQINERADIQLADLTFSGQLFGFYTDYVFTKKDTIAMRLYSLLPEHYTYAESIEDAARANLNPFAQPATLRSNVKGGLGIFTTLNFDEKKDIILK